MMGGISGFIRRKRDHPSSQPLSVRAQRKSHVRTGGGSCLHTRERASPETDPGWTP